MKIFFKSQNSSLSIELLGTGFFQKEKGASKKEFSGNDGETQFVSSSPVKYSRFIWMIGIGKKEKFTLEKVRQSAAKTLFAAKSFKTKTAGLDLDSFSEKFSIDEIAAAAVEGTRLSDYRFDKYKSKPGPKASVEEFVLVSKNSKKSKEIQRAINQAEIISSGVIFARNLANEPANVMTPQALAKAAKEMAVKSGLSCRVLGKNQIKALKMGGILGVAQGSDKDPQFIILENRVRRALFKDPIVLVGKGVTFDTGGISIKPSGDMDKMKFDMCGAAAVLGAMKSIADLKLPVKVVGLMPVCENMPGSSAQRPGDIITCLNGKTVEVLNTDAEGRLILADALAYSKKYKPKILIDIATLTGACSATFSNIVSGLMSTDPELAKNIQKAGDETGERVWELPLWDEYFDLIKASYADIQNTSKKYAGTITAGMFLKEFANHTSSWAHLDIAGTAWNESGPKLLSPIGATGVGVRLFVRLVKSYAKK